MDKPNPPSVLAPSEIIPAMEKIISKIHHMQEHMVNTVTQTSACFANVFQAWAEVANETQSQLGMIWLLSYAAPDQETHDAVNVADRLFNEAVTTWTSRTDLFALLRAAADRNEKLDPESRLWVQSKLRDFISAGHGLADEQTIKQYLSKRSAIDQLRKQYNDNLRNNNAGLWIEEADLIGVPESDMKSWTMGSDENDGKRFVPFANGGYKTVMARAHKAETREKMYLAEEAKVPANVDILRSIIAMRDSQARLLGYDNHGSFRIQNRAIKSTEYVQHFLEQLKQSLVPHGRDELQALRQVRDEHRLLMENVASDHGFTENDRFYPWDLEYYKRIYSLQSQIDDTKISQFFPLEHTILRMLRLFESFLGLKFTQIPSDRLDPAWIWNEDVQIWEAWDNKEGQLMGFLYFDILWRENKYKGSQNVNIEQGYLKSDGTRNLPATVLMCSFPRSAESNCVLLKHREVVTLFHELGHGIHDLISRTKFSRFHGTQLPVDFGEMPSTLLENWCWNREILKQISHHYTFQNEQCLSEWHAKYPEAPYPPAQIPDDLLETIVKFRNTNRGLRLLHILVVSIFDLKIHTPQTHEEIEQIDLSRLWYDLREEIEGLDMTRSRAAGHEQATFGHLLSGYDMGYYGYLSCLAYAQDVFQENFAKDLHNREVWDDFRRGILEYGGSHPDQLQMLREYLGREPNYSALQESLLL
ncbi:hypothetical protein ACQKWADRAFT_298655 [Trichoderma austrokoningii]